jgi:hypothetical protein
MPTKVSLAPRPPDGVREQLWTLGKGPRRLACELCDHGPAGAEYWLLVDGEAYARRRFGRVDLAVLGTEDLRRQFEHDGWTGRSRGGVSPLDAVTPTTDAIELDVAGLIKRSRDLQDEAQELNRTAEALARKAARLWTDLAVQKRP